MKTNRFTLLMAAFPFVLYACGSDDSGGGGVKKDAGSDSGKDSGAGGTAATGGVGAIGGTGGAGLTGGSGGSTGGAAGSGGGVAGSGGGVAGAAGGGGVAGAAGTDGGVAGSPSGGAAGADASVGGSAGAPADSGVGGTDGGTTTLGDTCSNPFVIASTPFVNSSTTVGTTADYGYGANACPPMAPAAGSGAPDEVYSFTPTVSGNYLIQLTGAPGFDSNLYVATDCANVDTTCIAGDDDVCSDCTESVTLTAVANTTYYIFVDGWQTSPTTTGGAYTLQVDAVAAPTNDTCANATPITTVPFYQVNDTTSAAADYGFGANSCAGVSTATGAGANDLVYSFTPTTTGAYVVNVGTNNFDAAVYVATDCAMIDATCLGAADSCSTNCVESRTFNATAGTTYYVFVDGWETTPTPANSGQFTFSLTTPLPGDTCGNAIPVPSVPFTDSGNTVAYLNDYGYSTGSCPPETGGWGDGSSDVVYSFTPTLTGEYEIHLSGFDATVYVVTNCADVDNSCVAGTENGCPTSSCDQVLTTTLTAGTTYYIIADGYSNGGNVTGAYQLDIVKNP